MKKKIAQLVSVAGHPLLTIPLYAAFVLFTFEDVKTASFNSAIIIGCIFIPLILRLYLKSRNGSYTNFDVSDRKQRKSIFFFIIPLLSVVTATVFITGQSRNLCLSLLFALVLVVISQLVNLFIKSSMHVSFHLYLSFLVMTLNYRVGVIVLLIGVPIAWSRMVLGRHTLKEVVFGGAIGLTVGLCMFYAEGYL